MQFGGPNLPFALLIIGAVLLVSAVRNTQDDLFKLIQGDFTGQGNFVFWVVSLLIIGAVGYIPKLKPVSDGFLVLVLVVLFLTRGNPSGVGGGFFSKFTQALQSTTVKQAATQTASSTPQAQPVSVPTLPSLGSLPGGVAV